MNYKELQDEVIEFRFNEGKREVIKRLLNNRYGMVWGAADWPFKFVHREDISVVSGQAAVPAEMRRPLMLETDGGDIVGYVDAAEWRDNYRHNDSNSGSGEFYTVVNDTIYVGPSPAGTVTYKLSYERRPAHLANGVTDTAGLMDSDTDEPLWPSEHHYLLVFGAMSDGLKLENDNTWPALEEAYESGLRAMMDDLLPAMRGVTLQYGRDGA